jgi:uncharacterized protein YndB with AHSA1/START domain
MTTTKTSVTVEATVKAPIGKVWDTWNAPQHITKWCAASEDWHAPKAENDLRDGGTFTTRMEAKDGSFGFDFGGVYTKVQKHKLIDYELGDGRKVHITFQPNGNETKIVETFDTESENPVEMQREGWQAILNNYKNYTEKN